MRGENGLILCDRSSVRCAPWGTCGVTMNCPSRDNGTIACAI